MMENVEEVKRKSKGKESRFGKRYGFELKLRCVKLRLEEGLPVSLLSKELGVSKDVVYRWVRAYQERGEAGLRNQVRSSESRRRLPGPVREPLPGIGKLFPSNPNSHIRYNPATGEAIKIPAKTVVKMRVVKAAKEAIVPGRK
jgi:transposase-like protein